MARFDIQLPGCQSTSHFEVRLPCTIGSGRTLPRTITLDDPRISDLHARVDLTEQGYVLRDMGSLNGTFVNGRRLTSEHVLQDRDQLLFGALNATFVLDSSEQPVDCPAILEAGSVPNIAGNRASLELSAQRSPEPARDEVPTVVQAKGAKRVESLAETFSSLLERFHETRGLTYEALRSLRIELAHEQINERSARLMTWFTRLENLYEEEQEMLVMLQSLMLRLEER